MTGYPIKPIDPIIWAKRLKTDGATNQLLTLVDLIVDARSWREICIHPFPAMTTEQHRAAVMAEIEAASYQDGKG